jgi:hypothetical protein
MATEQVPPHADLRDPRRRRRDVRAFFWLCGWGGATAIALIAFVITTQTKTASDRLRRIFAINEPTAVAQMPPRVAQLEIETQFLTEQMRALAADRDRLAGRITLLESSIDDMTGAIKKQAAATAGAVAAKTAQSALSAPGTLSGTSAVTAGPNSATNASAAQLETPTSSMAAVPLPPPRVAAAPATEPETPSIPVEFGLDLGGASTVDGVRQRWITVKANFGPFLSGMYPLAAHEHRAGSTGYRLVVGPLPNSAAATSLCAHFTAARTACRSAKFDGEQIAQR